MNSLILHNIKKKSLLRKKIKRSSSPSEHLKKWFRDLRTNIKRMLRESRKEYINSICTSREHNPKRFWSFFKLKSKVSHIPGKVSRQLNEGEGKRRSYVENSIDIANTFNEYFASIFTQETDNLETKHYQDEYDHLETNGMLTDIELLEDEVLSVLRNLDQNKTQGPDRRNSLLHLSVSYIINHCALVYFLVIGNWLMLCLSINDVKNQMWKIIVQSHCSR